MAAVHNRMFKEAADAPRQLEAYQGELRRRVVKIVGTLHLLDPGLVVTCGRGSSDHAATFAKYLIEITLRIPTLSHALSISSLYHATSPKLSQAAALFFSQSGRSPDLLVAAREIGVAGALRIALVNDADAPLAHAVDQLLPVGAGPEISVAATKSVIATLAAVAMLVAEWSNDAELRSALQALPTNLHAAWHADWSEAQRALVSARSVFVLGRGLTLGIAQEAALKFKETSGLHAEAFSTAEVAHGPMALVGKGFPVLFFPSRDASGKGVAEQVAAFRERGAITIVAGEGFGGDIILPLPHDLHPAIAPIVALQSFYRLVNGVAVHRGIDPDYPPFLSKITRTL